MLWTGDFETGDINQWSKAQSMGPDRLAIVSSPVAQGRFALKATVRKGDDPIGASGHRNELLYLGLEGEGDERFYKWSTLWPDDYASAPGWQLFTQWHQMGDAGSPPVEFYVRGEEMVLRVSGTEVWTRPLVRGAWHDFVFHVMWSSSEAKGFVELLFDGETVLAKRPVATLFPREQVYMKQGLYRKADIAPEQVLFHDGMTVATTLEDVMPAATRAPAPRAPAAAVPATAPASPLGIPGVHVATPEERATLPRVISPTSGGWLLAPLR